MSGIKAKLANGYRISWGLFFLGSAVFNALVSLPNSEKVLEAFERLSIPGADALLRALMPYAAGLIAAVVAFEAVVGVLILSKSRQARLGLGASIAWVVGLVPFLSWYGTVNIVLALSLVPVIRQDFDKSLYDMTLGRLGGRHAGRILGLTGFAVTAFMAIAAFFGGIALMTNDDFVPGGYLEKTPFSSWVIPGILLIALVALPMLYAAAVVALRKDASAVAITAAGAFLVAWIVGQLTVLDYGMVLQPAMLLAGLAIMGLGFLTHVRLGERPWQLPATTDRYLDRISHPGTPGRFGGVR